MSFLLLPVLRSPIGLMTKPSNTQSKVSLAVRKFSEQGPALESKKNVPLTGNMHNTKKPVVQHCTYQNVSISV